MGGNVSTVSEAKQAGNDSFKQGNWGDAVEAYTRALDADPRDQTLYSNRCAARLKMGQDGFALKDALVCVSLAPSWSKGYYRLGNAYSAIKRHTDAVDAFLKALALSPQDQAIKAVLEELLWPARRDRVAEEKIVGLSRARGYVYTWGASEAVGLSTATPGGRSVGGDALTPKAVDLVKGRQVLDVSCGLTHTVVITAVGEALVWGQNKHGQCGVRLPGAEEVLQRPAFVAGLLAHRCLSVACGGGHTLVLTDMGKVFSWGTGSCGQLGHGAKQNFPWPKQIQSLEGQHVSGVACGFGHTIVVVDGACLAFGWNRDGQCGSGNRQDVLSPQKIKGLQAGVSIQHGACGGGHTVLISHKGDAYSFGSGSCGQLGHGDSEDQEQAKLVQCKAFAGPLAAVTCGEEYTIFVSAAREVFGCGLNNVGQLGGATQEETSSVPVKIPSLSGKGVELCSCTQGAVLAVTAKGEIWQWGTLENSGVSSESMKAMLSGKPAAGFCGVLPKLFDQMSKREVTRFECGRRHFCVIVRCPRAEECTAQGGGLSEGSVGRKAKFTITARNDEGNSIGQGGDRFDVLIFTEDGDCVTKVHVDDNMDGTYSCEYTPHKAGACVAWVRLGGVHVKGSPFAIEISAGEPSVSECFTTPVLSEGTYYHVAGKKADIILDVCDKFGNPCSQDVDVSASCIHLVDEDALEVADVSLTYKKMTHGRHAFSLTPDKIGTYVATMKVKGQELSAPVDFEVVPAPADAKTSSASGDGLKWAVADETASFKVVCKDKSGNLGLSMRLGFPQDYDEVSDVPLLVRVREILKGGGAGEELPVMARSSGVMLGAGYARGEFMVQYVPKRLGEVQVEVMIGGINVKGSPFAVKVQGGPTCARTTRVRESDLEGCSLRDGAAKRGFLILAEDSAGNRRTIGGDVFKATLTGPGDKGGSSDVSISDGKDGTHKGALSVSAPGRYTLSVSLGSEQICGSPYAIDFSPDPAEEIRRRHEAQERKLKRDKEAEQLRREEEMRTREREALEELELAKEREAARKRREEERKAKQAKLDANKDDKAKGADLEKRRRLMEKLRKEEEVRRKAVALEEEKRNVLLEKIKDTEQRRARPGSATRRAGGGFSVSFNSSKD